MPLPPLDNTSLRSSRVSGTTRLALMIDQSQLSESTIETVIAAAADPQLNFTARRVNGFHQVIEFASAVNGPAWSYNVLIDARTRSQCFNEMWENARNLAAAKFRRLQRHDREETIDRIATELATKLRPVPGIGIKLSSWDAWYAWRYLLSKRLKGAVAQQDHLAMPGGVPYVSLDDALANTDAIEHQLAHQAISDDTQDQLSLDTLIWHSARHLAGERTAGLLAGCRGGAQVDRMAVVCQATSWLLERGAQDPHLRVMFTEDATSAKLASWWALVAVQPATWGRYPARAVPTRAVINQVAAAVSDRECACTVGQSDRLRRCWLHSVSSRLKDLNDRDRVLHLVKTNAFECLRAAAIQAGLKPTRTDRAAAASSRRGQPLAPPPTGTSGSVGPVRGPLIRQLRLNYPPSLGYDSSTLLQPHDDGSRFVIVEVVHSDEPHYGDAVRAHLAMVESG
jgi:hypothetical protein